MTHEEKRELLKNFSAEWNKRTFQSGQNFIHINDIDNFLSTLPEEKPVGKTYKSEAEQTQEEAAQREERNQFNCAVINTSACRIHIGGICPCFSWSKKYNQQDLKI